MESPSWTSFNVKTVQVLVNFKFGPKKILNFSEAN